MEDAKFLQSSIIEGSFYTSTISQVERLMIQGRVGDGKLIRIVFLWARTKLGDVVEEDFYLSV